MNFLWFFVVCVEWVVDYLFNVGVFVFQFGVVGGDQYVFGIGVGVVVVVYVCFGIQQGEEVVKIGYIVFCQSFGNVQFGQLI